VAFANDELKTKRKEEDTKYSIYLCRENEDNCNGRGPLLYIFI